MGSDDARAGAAARLLRATDVEVVAGVARAPLAPPGRPSEALAALKALAAPPRAAKAQAGGGGLGYDPLADAPEISDEEVLFLLRKANGEIPPDTPFVPGAEHYVIYGS
jgi:hypothetical protein